MAIGNNAVIYPPPDSLRYRRNTFLYDRDRRQRLHHRRCHYTDPRLRLVCVQGQVWGRALIGREREDLGQRVHRYERDHPQRRHHWEQRRYRGELAHQQGRAGRLRCGGDPAACGLHHRRVSEEAPRGTDRGGGRPLRLLAPQLP